MEEVEVEDSILPQEMVQTILLLGVVEVIPVAKVAAREMEQDTMEEIAPAPLLVTVVEVVDQVLMVLTELTVEDLGVEAMVVLEHLILFRVLR